MKRLLFSFCAALTILIIPSFSTAQKVKKHNKEEEVVIVKKGDKDAKVTVEMNGDNIMVNGKPLDEFISDEVTVKVYDVQNTLRKNRELLQNLTGNLSRAFSNWNDTIINGTHALLGVSTEKAEKGVKVNKVEHGTSAEKAGLEQGDIITSINNSPVNDPDKLVNIIHGFNPKDKIQIAFERNGKSKNTEATLGESAHVFRNFTFRDRNNFHNIPDENAFSDLFPHNGNEAFSFSLNNSHKLGMKIEDLDEGEGVRVTTVEEGSAAESAGIKKDDIITELDGNKVKDVNDARLKLRELNNKMMYSLRGKRKGADIVFNVKIPKRKNKADL